MGQFGCKGCNLGLFESTNEMLINSGDEDGYASEIEDIFSVSAVKPRVDPQNRHPELVDFSRSLKLAAQV